MGEFSDFFNPSGIGEQLLVWGVLNELIGAALGPAFTQIEQFQNSEFPITPLTPEQAAVAVVRGIITSSDGQSDAEKAGTDANHFALLQQLAQQPASLSLVLAGYQRSLGTAGPTGADLVDIDTALADLGIGEEYRPLIKALAVEIPTAQQVLNAWLEGQIEADEAQGRLLATGMDPSWIQTAYNSEGQAPTPVQALEMLNRGLIPETGTGPDSTSYQQAFLEGPWRNKWEPAFLGLRNYLPPPRTVTAILKEGAITEAQATAYLQAYGLDETLTAIYIAAASHTTTAAQRELTQAQVIDLYESKLVTGAEATADLVALKFSPSDAALLLALADKKQAASAAKSAVTRLQNLYLSGTNSLTVTEASLHQLGLTDDNVSNLIATWNLEKVSRVKELTEGQIVAGWYYGGLDPDGPTNTRNALARLAAIGYSAGDAMILLVARNHGPLSAAQGGAPSPTTA